MPDNEQSARIKLHPGQYRFVTSRKSKRAAICGVGGGKSVAGAILALKLAVVNEGHCGMVVAPTYDMLRLNTCPPIIKLWPQGMILNPDAMLTKSGGFTIRCANGSIIYFRTADTPDNLRGPNLAWAWLDEAGQMPKYAWEVVQGRVRVPCPESCIGCTTTPKGYNWLYDTFKANPPSDDYELISWGIDENRHNLMDGFYENLIASYPSALVRQEVYGEFVNINASSYLNADSVIACQSPKMPLMPKSKDIYLGVDVGRKHDLTVIYGVYSIGDTVFTAIYRTLRGQPYSVQRDAIGSLMPHCLQCCIDATGLGNQLAEELANEWGSLVEPVIFTNQAKAEMAARARALFEQGRIRIPDDPELRNDLLSIETQVGTTGIIKLAASRSEDGHADRFWALSLAVRAHGGIFDDVIFARL